MLRRLDLYEEYERLVTCSNDSGYSEVMINENKLYWRADEDLTSHNNEDLDLEIEIFSDKLGLDEIEKKYFKYVVQYMDLSNKQFRNKNGISKALIAKEMGYFSDRKKLVNGKVQIVPEPNTSTITKIAKRIAVKYNEYARINNMKIYE